MLSTALALARITVRRTPRNLAREAVVGIAVGASLALGFWVSAPWTFLVVMLYGYAVQAIGMTENDVFFDVRDLRRLGFRELTPACRAVYLGHYLARDMYLANLLALGIGAGALVAFGQPALAVLLFTMYLGNLLLLTSHVHLAFRMSARARTAYLVALLLGLVALATALVLGVTLPGHLVPFLPLGHCCALGVHVVAVDLAARRLHGNGLSTYGSRAWYLWLRRLSPHLFKDVLLGQGMAVQSLTMGLALFALLASGTPKDFFAPIVLLALCHDNIFLARRDRAYRLITDDNLFRADRLPADATYLRRSKLLTLALDVPLTFGLSVVLLLVTGALRADQLPLILLVIVTGFVLDAELPFADALLTRVVRSVVKYTIVVLFFVTAHLAWTPWPLVAYCLLLWLMYVPRTVAAYAGRKWGQTPFPPRRLNHRGQVPFPFTPRSEREWDLSPSAGTSAGTEG